MNPTTEVSPRDTETAEREAWISAHGSERLQRLLAEGIEHGAVYRDERLEMERPGWRWRKDVPGRDYSPRNAPMEALELLDRAREQEPSATLRYWVRDSPSARDRDPWYGYVAMSKFLGRDIVYGGP